MVSHNHEDHSRGPRDEGQRIRSSGRKSRPKRQASRSSSTGKGHTSKSSDSSFDSKDSFSLTKITVPTHTVMDFFIVAVFSVIISSGIVIGVYGYRNVTERVFNLDLFDVILQLILFAGLIGIIMYILLRLAAHYIVYLGISVFLNMIFLLKPDKAKASMKSIYNKK